MGHILKEIKNTSKGLIGLTKLNEEILLSKPKMGVLLKGINELEFLKCDGAEEKQKYLNSLATTRLNTFLKGLSEGTYIQLGSLSFCGGLIIQPYNLYTERK